VAKLPVAYKSPERDIFVVEAPPFNVVNEENVFVPVNICPLRFNKTTLEERAPSAIEEEGKVSVPVVKVNPLDAVNKPDEVTVPVKLAEDEIV